MKTAVIYAHPWDGSFNHAVLESALKGIKESGNDFELIDLNAEGFEPAFKKEELALYSKGKFIDPKVGEYQNKLDKCQEIILIFPIWWGTAPAILKGFFDKILLKDWAYDQMPNGYLKGKLTHIKKVTIFTTMAAPRIGYELFIKKMIKSEIINWTLKTCGVKKSKIFPLCNVVGVTKEKREMWLKNVEDYCKNIR